MNQLASIFLLQPDEKDAAWERYHANTKLSPWRMPPAAMREDPVAELNDALRKTAIEEIESVVGSGGKRYPTTEKLVLPDAWPAAFETSLGAVLGIRSSQREFSPSPLSIEQLAAVCRSTCGFKPAGADIDGMARSRCIPSAGALYPLELYLFSLQPLSRSEKPKTAEVWHYEPQKHSLERVTRCDPARITGCFQTWPELPPPMVAVLTGVPKRQSWKYGARAYRYTVMEAGHAVQNMVLGATAMELNSCPVVGFYDDRIHDLLDIDGVSEIALYTVWLGHQP